MTGHYSSIRPSMEGNMALLRIFNLRLFNRCFGLNSQVDSGSNSTAELNSQPSWFVSQNSRRAAGV